MARFPPFPDREEAGSRLAAELPALDRPIVLALPRGGVPVAAAVARALGAPLDVFVVRKLGLPAQPELAMGAIASGGVRVLNDEVLRQAAVPAAVLEEVTARERAAVEARERLYRGDRPAPALAGRDVVLVDDGLATGATMRAAVVAVRAHGPSRVVVAVPIAPAETVAAFRWAGIELACVHVPDDFVSVGSWYRDFGQVSDEEVIRLFP
ncbi:MAG TPA: phosphoribosyltransferase family protein [Gaiellaceae bacterium]|nr:phosphoribosyltransferase family protein [Gaiellaceae bacterium]